VWRGRRGRAPAQPAPRTPAAPEPQLAVVTSAVPGVDHHDLVIPAEAEQLELLSEYDEPLEDAAAVRAAVHVIAESDDEVVGRGGHPFQEVVERAEAAVDVAD